MRIEWWILLAAYVVSTGLLFFIPKGKTRLAVVAFLFKQAITFLFGLLVVELGLLKYPMILFPNAYRASFTFEYYVFPVFCALFNARYPSHRSALIQLGYYAVFSSILTIVEVLIEKNVNLIQYVHWEWYTTWISMTVSFYITRLFCIWFFAKEKTRDEDQPKSIS